MTYRRVAGGTGGSRKLLGRRGGHKAVIGHGTSGAAGAGKGWPAVKDGSFKKPSADEIKKALTLCSTR